MELWIRAQNRNFLTKVNEIHLHEKIEDKCEIEGFIDNAELTLGKYKSRERCLKIIDEIQLLLENNGSIDDRISQAISKIKNEFIVYEMPQE